MEQGGLKRGSETDRWTVLAGGDEHTKGNTCYRIGNMISEKPIHLVPLSGERTAEKFTIHMDNFAFIFTMFRQEPW